MSQAKHMKVYVLKGEYRNAFGIMTRVGGVELDLELAKERLDELNARSKKYVYEIETIVIGSRSAARYPNFASLLGANLATKTQAVRKVVVVVRDLSTRRTATKPDDGLLDDEVSGASAVKMLTRGAKKPALDPELERALKHTVSVVSDVSSRAKNLRKEAALLAKGIPRIKKSKACVNNTADFTTTFPLRGKPINTLATLLADSLKLEQSKPWPWPKAADFKKPRPVLAAY